MIAHNGQILFNFSRAGEIPMNQTSRETGHGEAGDCILIELTGVSHCIDLIQKNKQTTVFLMTHALEIVYIIRLAKYFLHHHDSISGILN